MLRLVINPETCVVIYDHATGDRIGKIVNCGKMKAVLGFDMPDAFDFVRSDAKRKDPKR